MERFEPEDVGAATDLDGLVELLYLLDQVALEGLDAARYTFFTNKIQFQSVLLSQGAGTLVRIRIASTSE